MARWTDRRARFRAVLNGDGCVSPASVFDPMSARLAKDAGYETGILAGSVASMAVLGAPDLILLTLSELSGLCQRVSRASDLPLLIDADHGYGNALNVMRTVEELEAAGVAALSIEDTDLPPRFGSAGTPTLLPIDESIGKMRAAVAAKPDPTLVVAGRTSAAALSGTQACCERVRAFSGCDVDAIFLVGVPDRSSLDAIAAETDLPLILGSAGPDLKDRAYLAARGVRMLLTGHQPIHAALHAVAETYAAQRAGAELPSLPDKERVATALRKDDYNAWVREFLEG